MPALSESLAKHDYTPPWYEQLQSEIPVPDPHMHFGHFVDVLLDRHLATDMPIPEGEELFVIPFGQHNEALRIPKAVEQMCETWGPWDKAYSAQKKEWTLYRNGLEGELVARVYLAESRIVVPIDRANPVGTKDRLRTMVHAVETALWTPAA